MAPVPVEADPVTEDRTIAILEAGFDGEQLRIEDHDERVFIVYEPPDRPPALIPLDYVRAGVVERALSRFRDTHRDRYPLDDP